MQETIFFKKLLEAHEIPYRQIKHTDPEFEKYPELVKESIDTSVVKLAVSTETRKLPSFFISFKIPLSLSLWSNNKENGAGSLWLAG